MRILQRSAGLLASVGCAVVALAIASGPAAADSCPSEETVLPYNGSSKGYQCAQMESSGKKSLSPWQTKSWSKTIAYGYPVKSHCTHKNGDGVSVSESWSTSSYTATATNWETKTKKFSAGVLFTTGNVNSSSYSNGCDNEGRIENSIVKITDISVDNKPATLRQFQTYTINVTLSHSDAVGGVAWFVGSNPVAQAPVVNGKATLQWESQGGNYETQSYVAYSGDNSACPTRNKSCGWTPAQTKPWDVTVVNDGAAQPATASAAASTAGGRATGLAATASSIARDDRSATAAGTRMGPNFGLITLQRTKRMPARISRRCPDRYVLVNAEVLTDSSKRDPRIATTRRGATVRSENRLRGVSTTLQITCRKQNAPRLVSGRLGYGTPRADRITTADRSSAIFGGLGADRLMVTKRDSAAFGGPGADTIVVRARDGVAVGGPGRDRMTSTARGRSLLVGSGGRDTLIGSPHGATRLNAADGRGGDTVICRGSSNRALVDSGDRVRGDCAQVRRI